MVFARERESSGGEIRAKEGLSHKRETSANENMTCLSSLISWSHHAPKSSLQLTENIRFSNSSLQLTENISFLVFVSSSELEIIASIQCLYTCFLYVYYRQCASKMYTCGYHPYFIHLYTNESIRFFMAMDCNV